MQLVIKKLKFDTPDFVKQLSVMYPSLYKQGDSYETPAFFYLQEIPIEIEKEIYITMVHSTIFLTVKAMA